jgi:tetratricopeptide (TPR) repeat protein
MSALLLVLLLAASVKDGPTALRSGCSSDASTSASLPAGAPVTIRYSISGESQPCYKVSAEVNGKTVEGYLPASAIGGLEDFDQARRQAVWLDAATVVSTIRASTALPSLRGDARGLAPGIVKTAADLIDSSRPQRALELLEPELKIHHDPALLALAGIAAWRADDSRQALEYWRASLDIAPNAEVEKLYHQAEREAKGDQSNERLYGLRVLLRYESPAVPTETARQMTAVLDQEFARISHTLGCSAEERVIAIVQSLEAYRKSTDTAEWNGGLFDGRIHVPIFDPKVPDRGMLRALSHETVHACLTMLGHWPAWLHEGIAQKLSGDSLGAAQMKKIADLARLGKLPRLSNLKQDWSRMDADHAAEAYALSLAAVELFWQESGEDGVRSLLRNPDKLPQVTADLDRKLGL